MHNLSMAKEWLKASMLDLNVIKEIINIDTLTSMIAFHSQQSIEKCLKAIPTIEEAKEFYDFAKNIFEKICKEIGVEFPSL